MIKGRQLVLLFCAVFTLCIALSFVHPWGDLRTAAGSNTLLSGTNVPSDVRQLIATKCADCHSNNTHWPLYSRAAPGSWLMEYDVHEGREHLNLSSWSQYDADTRVDLLAKIARESLKGEMPVRQYLWLHPSAKLTDEERQNLATWASEERKRLRKEISDQ